MALQATPAETFSTITDDTDVTPAYVGAVEAAWHTGWESGDSWKDDEADQGEAAPATEIRECSGGDMFVCMMGSRIIAMVDTPQGAIAVDVSDAMAEATRA